MKKVLILISSLALIIGVTSCSSNKNKGDNVDNFTREELSFGIKDFEVKGELVKPKDKKGPFKLAVIVGGSGPTSRDANIGEVHPYKDIAEGLANKGIASFRFDKRILTYQDKFNDKNILDFTIKEEYLEYYNEIIKYMSSRDDIDKSSIYTIGHSLGGYVIPMLESTNPTAKGYIFLAANSTRLEDAVIEQSEMLLKDNTSGEVKKQLEEMIKEAKKVKTLNTTSPNEMILGAGLKYWMGLKSYDVLKEVKNINKPMIFLQGLNDYQVTIKDVNGFENALKGKEKVEFKKYEGLTHTFTKGEAKPSAYMNESKVEQEVIDDIADFINKN